MNCNVMLPPQSGNLTKIFNGIWNYLLRHTTSVWQFNSSARLFYWVKAVTYTRIPVRIHVCKTCRLLAQSLCVHKDLRVTIICEFNIKILMKIGLNGRLCSVLYLNNGDMAALQNFMTGTKPVAINTVIMKYCVNISDLFIR